MILTGVRLQLRSETRLGPLPPGQFRIFDTEASNAWGEDDKGARRVHLDRFIIECGEFVTLTPLADADSRQFGLVIGNAFVVDLDERLSSSHFSEFISSEDKKSAFEQLYERLFGTFIVIIRFEVECYLYLDAGGCLSAVYSKELGIVGATAAAILPPGAYESRFQRDLYAQLDVANDGWFPSGLTAHRGVSRLLCNHRLNLQDLTPTRHWPVKASQRSDNAPETLQRLASAIQGNLCIVFDHFRAALAVTGGADSRALLSLLRDRRNQLVTYIVDTGPDSALDIYLSERIARTGGLQHRVLSPLAPDPEIERRWRFRCGDAIGGLNARIHTALRRLDDRDAIVDGSGAETARGFFWKDADSFDTRVTAEMISRRLGMPAVGEVVEATERWLEGAPKGDAFFTLDLAYLELRNSAWAYAGSYVDPPLLHFSPYISRRTIAAMFQLPIATKMEGFPQAIVRMRWPELSEIPYNRYADMRDWLRMGRRAANINRVAKKLRKLMAP